MERNTDEERTRLERSWLNADPRLRGNTHWWNYRCTSRSYLHQLKRFVVWEARDGKPQIVDLLQTTSVGISWEHGVEAILESAKSDQFYTIDSTPRELIEGIFLWIPGFSDVRFAPIQYSAPGPRRLTIPICFRTRHSHVEEGARYITPYNEFEKLYPGIF